jgi:uncharacterized protein YvpB
MSQLKFQLDFLDGIVGTLRRMAGEHEDMARSLNNHAGAAQSLGADGWIVDQVRFAASLLSGHPDLFYQLSSELDHRLQIAHSVADEWQGPTTGLRVALTGAMTVATGLLANTSKSTKVNQTAQKADKRTPKIGSSSAVASVAALTHGLRGRVPLESQLGSAYKDTSSVSSANLDTLRGDNNCGPTSLSMAINFYAGKRVITPLQAANYVRGGDPVTGASSNYYQANHGHGTNFGLDGSTTASHSLTMLADHGLQLNQVASGSTKGLADIERSLDAGHPVVLLVDNNQYAAAGKSGSAIYGSTTDVLTKDHIVLVTGYDPKSQVVYINDPLASQSDYAISMSDLEAAAINTTSAPGAWYGAAVSPLTSK